RRSGPGADGRSGADQPGRLDLRFEPGAAAADHPPRPQRPDAGPGTVPGQRQGASAGRLRLQPVAEAGAGRQPAVTKRRKDAPNPAYYTACDQVSHYRLSSPLGSPQRLPLICAAFARHSAKNKANPPFESAGLADGKL